jgi:hypothetical protein
VAVSRRRRSRGPSWRGASGLRQSFGSSTTAWLAAGERCLSLKRLEGDGYAAHFAVPAGTAPGEYHLRVWNGWGGAAGERRSTSGGREEPRPLGYHRIQVRSSGAADDGVRNDTPAFREALAKAEFAGGGVVLIPGGRYKITAKLVVPPHTIVRGAEREAVWLFVPKEEDVEFTPRGVKLGVRLSSTQ